MKLIFISLTIFFLSIFIVNAALTCTTRQNSCQAGETAIFRMSGLTNAHAEIASGSNYNYVVCCSGVTNLGTACTGDSKSAVVLSLSGTSNAHGETGTGVTYTNKICLSADYSVNCYSTSTSCNSGDTCVFTASSDPLYPNAHLAACSPDTSSPYDTKVCCNAVSCQDLFSTCSGTGQGDCCSGYYCSHGQDGTLPDGESHCCADGWYWDGIQCRTSGLCNPTPCPYTNADPRYWKTPGCFRYTPKPYEQACCLTDLYGSLNYYYTNAVVH